MLALLGRYQGEEKDVENVDLEVPPIQLPSQHPPQSPAQPHTPLLAQLRNDSSNSRQREDNGSEFPWGAANSNSLGVEGVSSESEGWPKMYKYLRDFDEDKVKDSKEDVDTLLVFAGLFSAVLTAFIIVSYALLQPDNGAATVLLLERISLQLGNASTNGAILQLPPLPSLTSFSPSASALRINGLWFASLTFSLITASLGMLVKQWLREYMAVEMISPKERCRVRHFRQQGMVKWRVFEIAASLPLLLQLALILFFIGLLDFIRLANERICWAITSIIAAYLLFYIITTISPVISARSPFKTPFLMSAFWIVRAFLQRNIERLSSRFLMTPYTSPLEEKDARKRDNQDVAVIVAADATFRDPEFFDNIHLCVRDLGGPKMVECVQQLMEQRLGRPVVSLDAEGPAFWSLSGPERLASIAILFDSLRIPLLQKYESNGTRRELHWNLWMDQALFGIHMAIRAGLDVGSRTIAPPVLIQLVLSYSMEFARSLLKHMSRVRIIVHLRHQEKRAFYLPSALSSQGVVNLLSGATELFVAKEIKPLVLWLFVLRILCNLPDDDIQEFPVIMRRVTEAAGRAIQEDLPNCYTWESLHLRALAAADTTELAERTSAVAEPLVVALHERLWEPARQTLARRRVSRTAPPSLSGT